MQRGKRARPASANPSLSFVNTDRHSAPKKRDLLDGTVRPVVPLRLSVAGLDLPVKLRRGLGNGKVVPADELAKRLAPYDRDKDGSLTQEELVRFLEKNHVGGPWFCQVLAKTLWRIVEERWAQEVESIPIEGLGRIINFTMSAPPRPEKRYVLDPEAMTGQKPKQTLEEYRASQAGIEKPKEQPKVDGTSEPARPATSAAQPRPRPAPRPGPPPARRPAPRPTARPKPRK